MLNAPESTAWSMIVSAGAGDGSARDRFARTYGPIIRAYLAARWRLPADHESIDDGTQEVFVQCFKPSGALSEVDPGGPARFRSYLFVVVQHVADRLERRERRRRTDQDLGARALDEVARTDASLSRVFDRAWVAMITRSAWLLMASRTDQSPGGRDRLRILDLRFRDGLAAGGIAQRLHLEAGYVYQQLRNAKRDFRSALLEVMSNHHPSASKAELEARCVDLLGFL